ncbi:MAG: response regulator [Alphaproteobacteria bacterium]|nr:histidine kinase [Alphaproteobacteria bacterium]MCS5598000.1 response regulator [Alphaproteobacteria bacterium]|tara:strand:+ start:431 stop:1369 length:939 start_codon:yes stop_codon:yes gene_type:complete
MSEALTKYHRNNHKKVLAVEDDATSRFVLVNLLEELGYDPIEAEDGREALAIMENDINRPDIIVLDKIMPGMDGLEVVLQLKKDPALSHIPIVMVTGSKTPEEVKEGIDAGVFYYLVKPYEEEVFKSVIDAAMREADRRTTLRADLKKHQTSFGFINKAEFTIRTIDEAEDLACFIANCFPNPDRALPGLASLLVNAVEHGNLELGYEEKSVLLKSGKWKEILDLRQRQDNFKDRAVQVTLERNAERTLVNILDEGQGFDWKEYMDIDPSRALETHGRGIAQANKISFDNLEYSPKGNAVTAIARAETSILW